MKEEAEYGKWKGAVRASELGNWVHILSHILSTNDLCNTLESRGESERERERELAFLRRPITATCLSSRLLARSYDSGELTVSRRRK